MGENSRQKARVAVVQQGCGFPMALLLESCAVQSTRFPTPLGAADSRTLNTRHDKHVMPSQRGSARRGKVAGVKLWGWCWAGPFQLPTCCACCTSGHARGCLQSQRCVPETVLQPSPPPCEPSSGVTADKPQHAEVV